MLSPLEKYRGAYTLSMSLVLFALPMMRVGEFGVPVFWDDISIVFVYALNLLSDGSIFYNEPADRIDGFTSMLDVLFIVPLALVDPENLFRLNFYAKAVLTSALPVAFFWLLLSYRVHLAVAGTLALCVAVSATLAHGFGMQLEAPLYGLLMLAFFGALTADTSRAWLLTLLAVLLVLTRPEALVLVTVAYAAFLLLLAGDPRARPTLQAAGATALLLAGWFGWRILHFGYWAPNTYYAKLSTSRSEEIVAGLQFVGGYFTGAPESLMYVAFVILTVALLPALLRNDADQRTRYFGVFALIALAMLAVRIATGGDSYTISYRLLMDFFVPAALAIGIGLTVCTRWPVTNAAIACVVLGLAGNGLNVARQFPGNITGFVSMERFRNVAFECERDAMRNVHARYPEARLAHTDFQRAKYFVREMEVIDLSGLNNREIAHSTDGDVNIYGKHDLQYALEQDVELLKIGTGVRETQPLTEAAWLQSTTADGETQRSLKGAREFLVANGERLSREYNPLVIATDCGDYLNLRARRDLR